MSQAISAASAPTGEPRATSGAGARPSGRVRLWALLGTAVVLLAVTTWTRWLLSPDAAPVDPGPDPYEYMWVLRATEVISLSVFAFLLWYTVIRPAHRQGTVTLDGKLFIGGFFASVLDVLCQVFNPTWAMNAHTLTLGTWANQFPGFAAPDGDRWAWSLAWCMPAYIWLGVGAAIVGCAYLDAIRRRFPRLSTTGAYAITLVSFMAVFGVIASIWNRTQVYTYVGQPNAVTLFADQPYRLPVTELLFIATYCLMFTWLRDSRDAAGRCAVDRDLDSVPPRWRTVVSTLAVCGYAGFTTVAGYQVPNDWVAMFGDVDSIPALPSYLQGGQFCGQPGKPLCPNQYLDQLRIDHEAGRSAEQPTEDAGQDAGRR